EKGEVGGECSRVRFADLNIDSVSHQLAFSPSLLISRDSYIYHHSAYPGEKDKKETTLSRRKVRLDSSNSSLAFFNSSRCRPSSKQDSVNFFLSLAKSSRCFRSLISASSVSWAVISDLQALKKKPISFRYDHPHHVFS